MKRLVTKVKYALCLSLILLLGINHKAQAQSASFGSSYAYGGGITSIVGQHDFQNGSGTISQGIIGSERSSNSSFGFLQGASWLNASDNAFIDGYATTYNTGAFTFPIGDNGKYRPAAVSAAATASPSRAAYYAANPSTAITSSLAGGNEIALPTGAPFAITSKGTGVATVTDKEYWDIKGATAAKISLTWDANSAIGTLTSNTLANLTIVGWNGTQWVKIPSTVDATSILGGASALSAGSITTDAALTPDTYTVYTFALSASCPTPTVAGTAAYSGGTVCTASNIGTVMLSGNTGDVVRWETSTNGGGAWSPITSVNAYYNFANAANAQQYRAVVNNGGSCLDAYATPATIATSAAACTNTTCDNLTGNVTINMTTPPSLATYDSKIIFTNASGVIQYVSANNATTLSGVAVGDYLVYQVLNDPTQLPAPTLTVGTNITAIGGACTKFSNQLAYKVCVCAASATTPSVSATTLSNACPATKANLGSITASNLPVGAKLTWHTATPATMANRVADSSMIAASGTYYAAFTDFANGCIGNSGNSTVAVTVTLGLCTSTPVVVTPPAGGSGGGNAGTELNPIGGTAPYTYSNGSSDPLCIAPVGATPLPASSNLTVNSSTGAYTYTVPTTVGTYYFCIKVCDNTTPTAICKVQTYTINVACGSGTVAPSLSATTKSNACPVTTADLSTITASNLPAGAKLTWHTATPATLANKVTDSTAVATAGTYYAAFTDFVNQCVSGAGTTSVTVTLGLCTSNPVVVTPPAGGSGGGNAGTELNPTGGTAPYTYSNGSSDPACMAPVGATPLPASSNLTVNSSTGVYTYTVPVAAGTYYFCIKVCDNTTPTAICKVVTYTINVSGSTAPDLITTIGQPSPALQVGVQSNLPITVANIGTGSAPGVITTTVTLPAGITAPATFTSNTWTCSTTLPSVTCTNAGPLAAGRDSTFLVPITPNASLSGTNPIFNGTTNPVVGETNTSNNAATPTTTTTPVIGGSLLSIKVLLQGNYDPNTGLMHDSLRKKGLLPLSDPYRTAAYSSKFTHKKNGATQTTTNAILAVTGANAIVDWVFIELRSSAAPATVIATKAALVQRDGDVVSADDGISPVLMDSIPNGNYYVAIRHRNHLGTMTATTRTLSATSTVVDFTTLTAAQLWNKANGDGYEQTKSGIRNLLWAGDTDGNRQTVFAGPTNDVDPVFFEVMTNISNVNMVPNYILKDQYLASDVNMDGRVIYQSADNEVDIILFMVLSHTLNTGFVPSYIIGEQLP